jgi:hypothetical protein
MRKTCSEICGLVASFLCLANCSSSSRDVGIAPDASYADAPLACMNGQTVCGQSCVDLQSSADNCLSCGHSCGPGACAQAQCQPYPMVGSLDRPNGLGVDDLYIYWSSLHSDLRKISKDGGLSTVIVPAVDGFNATNVVVDGSDIYWGQRGVLLRTSLNGDTSFPIGALGGNLYADSIIVDATSVFWLGPDAAHAIMMRPKNGSGDALPLVANVEASSLAQDDQYVYWSDDTTSRAPSIQRVAKTKPSGNEDLADLSSSAIGLAVDSDAIYWTALDGTVWRLFLTPGAQAQLIATGPAPAGSITLDHNNIYWIGGALDSGGTVMGLAKGGKIAHLYASMLGTAGMLTVDNDSIYFTDLGTPTPEGTILPNTGSVMRVVR